MKNILSNRHIVDHDIRDWEKKFVFRTSDIQIVEVDENLDLSVLLGDEYNVGYPIRVSSSLMKSESMSLSLIHI